MKILLVTRGSQGDVLPYLAIAAELERRGHEVTINLPQIFEETVKPYGFKYVLQQFDDIGGMIDSAAQNSHKFRPFLKWMRNVIDKQFDQLIPLLKEHDILVSTNSEFAVASIAEYCKKPLIRTAYAPFLPGKKIPGRIAISQTQPDHHPCHLMEVDEPDDQFHGQRHDQQEPG